MGAIVVTGSAGHLGEALLRTLRDQGADAVGLDVRPGPFTDVVASVTDRDAVAAAVDGADAVLHTTALWQSRGWRFAATIDRVHDNRRARRELGWTPRYDVDAVAELVGATGAAHTPLAAAIGVKAYPDGGYHRGDFGPAR